MAEQNKSNLWLIIGAIIVALAVIYWFMAGSAPEPVAPATTDGAVSVEPAAPATPEPAPAPAPTEPAPAAPAEPAPATPAEPAPAGTTPPAN